MFIFYVIKGIYNLIANSLIFVFDLYTLILYWISAHMGQLLISWFLILMILMKVIDDSEPSSILEWWAILPICYLFGMGIQTIILLMFTGHFE